MLRRDNDLTGRNLLILPECFRDYTGVFESPLLAKTKFIVIRREEL